MKATEAAKLADVIQKCERGEVLQNCDGVWRRDSGEKVDLTTLIAADYTPLVPLKTYKVGDVVTFAEALQSGRCFADNILVYKFEGNVFYYWCSAKKRWVECDTNLNKSSLYTYTIVADPSVPPKPTIKDLEPWTRFKANSCGKEYDVVMLPTGMAMDYKNGLTQHRLQDMCMCWTLTHIKRNGEWEEV